MEQSAKKVSQHLNSMLEHLKVPALIKNLNQSSSTSNNGDNSVQISNTDQKGNKSEKNHCTNHGVTRIEVNSVVGTNNNTGNHVAHTSEKNQNELNTMTTLGGLRPSDVRKQSCVFKPIKLRNVATKVETVDTLYSRASEVRMPNFLYIINIG